MDISKTLDGKITGGHMLARAMAEKGITKVFRAETDFVGTLTRTQLNGPDDIPALQALQAQVQLIPLSRFAGTKPPRPAATVNWPAWDAAQAEGIGLIGYLNALLPFMPTVPSEQGMMTRFARIGIGPGRPFDPKQLTPATRSAIEAGVTAASANLRTKALAQSSSKGFFGTRDELGSDYLTYRAMGAMLGIYGNSSAEALYASQQTGPDGKLLATGHADGAVAVWDVESGEAVAKHARAHFAPVTALDWSVTPAWCAARIDHDDDRWRCSSNNKNKKY